MKTCTLTVTEAQLEELSAATCEHRNKLLDEARGEIAHAQSNGDPQSSEGLTAVVAELRSLHRRHVATRKVERQVDNLLAEIHSDDVGV